MTQASRRGPPEDVEQGFSAPRGSGKGFLAAWPANLRVSGPNGARKTTTIKVLTVYRPPGGERWCSDKPTSPEA